MSEDVFILGAGFSKAISDYMPTLAELSEAIWPEVVKLFPENEIPPDVMGKNIETLLSYLAQDYPWLSQAHQLRNKAAFLDLSKIIAETFEEKQKKIEKNNIPAWLNLLVSHWNDNLIDVITFNYDVLIENMAMTIDAPEVLDNNKKSKIWPDDLFPVTINDASSRRASAMLRNDNHITFQLYKMHGSVTWYYSGSDEFYGEPIYQSWHLNHEKKEYRDKFYRFVRDKIPLIIPPTLDKTIYFKNETIRKIWLLAGQALNKAKRVFCLGYSFPTTDMMVRLFTLTNQSGNDVQFYWVNISKPHDDLRAMLPNSYAINDKYVLPDAISAFTNDYINGKLK